MSEPLPTEPHFGIEAATRATGATPQRIKNWIDRGNLMSDVQPAGRGRARSYTLENLMEFALLVAAADCGVSLAPARTAQAIAVARMVEGKKGIILAVNADTGKPTFIEGPRITAQGVFESLQEPAEGALVTPDVDLFDEGDEPRAAVIMNLGEIAARVRKRLR